jgi:hypothetical protein
LLPDDINGAPDWYLLDVAQTDDLLPGTPLSRHQSSSLS